MRCFVAQYEGKPPLFIDTCRKVGILVPTKFVYTVADSENKETETMYQTRKKNTSKHNKTVDVKISLPK